jgi:ribonuclease HIII
MVERMTNMARRFNTTLPEGAQPGMVEAFRRIDYRRR